MENVKMKIEVLILVLCSVVSFVSKADNPYDNEERRIQNSFLQDKAASSRIDALIERSVISPLMHLEKSMGSGPISYMEVSNELGKISEAISDARRQSLAGKYDLKLKEVHLASLDNYQKKVENAMSVVKSGRGENLNTPAPYAVQYRGTQLGKVSFVGKCPDGQSFAGSRDNVYKSIPFGASGPAGYKSGETEDIAIQRACGMMQ